MVTDMAYQKSVLRSIIMVTGGMIISLMIFALLPLLLHQTTFKRNEQQLMASRLIPLMAENKIKPIEDDRTPVPEPPPPEPEIHEMKPEPPQLKDIAVPEIEPPQIQPPAASIEPMEMEPMPVIAPQIQSPGITALSVKSMPVRSSHQNLKLGFNKAALPAALARPKPSVKPPDPRVRFNLDEVDRKPVPVSGMPPAYPYRARRLSIEGHVEVRFIVDRKGVVRELSLIEAKPEGVFENAVKNSVPRWRFKPGIKDGKPVETWVQRTIKFKLKES